MRQWISKLAAEVPELLGCSGNTRALRKPASLTTPLFVPEEKSPVLNDRSAEVEAEVVITKSGFRLISSIEEEIVCVQCVVAKELESGAVKLVAAAFGNQVDHRALGLA